MLLLEGELLAQWGPERLDVRHSAASTASCLPVQELDRQHPASLTGVRWDRGGPMVSWYRWWPEKLVCYLERRASLQSMTFVPPGLVS